jgi:hypothetical protein
MAGGLATAVRVTGTGFLHPMGTMAKAIAAATQTDFEIFEYIRLSSTIALNYQMKWVKFEPIRLLEQI